MKTLGNILWFIFGGCALGLSWFAIGVLWCITIIGIPIGKQCFKLAALSFCPFGRDITPGIGAGSLFLNIIWMIFGGIALAAESFSLGVACCITIIGIPFGMQYFKLALLSLFPFGAQIG